MISLKQIFFFLGKIVNHYFGIEADTKAIFSWYLLKIWNRKQETHESSSFLCVVVYSVLFFGS